MRVFKLFPIHILYLGNLFLNKKDSCILVDQLNLPVVGLSQECLCEAPENVSHLCQFNASGQQEFIIRDS